MYIQKSLIFTPNSPIYTHRSQWGHTRKSPVSHIQSQQSPTYVQKSLIFTPKSPIYTHRSQSGHTRKSPVSHI